MARRTRATDETAATQFEGAEPQSPSDSQTEAVPQPQQVQPQAHLERAVFRFKTSDGGDAVSTQPPQIHAALIRLRKAIGGLQARRQANGPAYAVKSAKDLGIKLRDALDTVGLIASVVGQDVTILPTDRGTACHVKSLIRVEAPDGSFRDFVGSGHGMDKDDKAGGKASTYAWKDAWVKGLNLPDAEMVDTDDEEGVGAEVTVVTPPQLPDSYATVQRLEACDDNAAVVALIAEIKATAKAAGPAGSAWGLKLTPAVKAALARHPA